MRDETKEQIRANREALETVADSDLPAAPIVRLLLDSARE